MISEDVEVEILFHASEGRSACWIAKRLGCGHGTVKSCVARGCLRRHLPKEDRWHEADKGTFLPSPFEIMVVTAKIRNKGFRYSDGEWHPPWSKATWRSRAVQRSPLVEAQVIPIETFPEEFRRMLLDESELL